VTQSQSLPNLEKQKLQQVRPNLNGSKQQNLKKSSPPNEDGDVVDSPSVQPTLEESAS